MGAGKTVKKKKGKKKSYLCLPFLYPPSYPTLFYLTGLGGNQTSPVLPAPILIYSFAPLLRVLSSPRNTMASLAPLGGPRGQPDLIYPQMGFRVPPRTSFAPPTPSTPLCNNERRTRTHECEPASQGACCTHARLRLKTGRRGRGREKGSWLSGVFAVIST